MDLINYVEDIKNSLFIKDNIYEVVAHRIEAESYVNEQVIKRFFPIGTKVRYLEDNNSGSRECDRCNFCSRYGRCGVYETVDYMRTLGNDYERIKVASCYIILNGEEE